MTLPRGLFRALAGIQGGYFLLTGIWPLAHMRSFIAITGPKTDLWLVETVGVLVAAIGLGLLLSAIRDERSLELPVVAVVAAFGLAAVDVIYSTRGIIARIYLADAAVEALFVAGWAIYAFGPSAPSGK